VLEILSLTGTASLSNSSYNYLPVAAIFSSFSEFKQAGVNTGTMTLNWLAYTNDASTINMGGLIKTNTGGNASEIVMARSGLYQISSVLQLTISNSGSFPLQFGNRVAFNMRTNSAFVTCLCDYRRNGNLLSLPCNQIVPLLADSTLTFDVGFRFQVAGQTISSLNGGPPNYKGTQLILKRIADYTTP